MDTTENRNRRQRIDDANAALSLAHSNQADAEAKAMRLSSDAARSELRVIQATKEVDAARAQLAEALAYEDVTVAAAPAPAARYPVNGVIHPPAGDDDLDPPPAVA